MPELCERYDIGKTNLYEVLWGGKYKKEISTPKPESVKPARQVTTIKLREAEETPQGKGHGKKSSLKKIQFISELNKNPGPYGTTNSSQRKYKLKS